MENLKLAILIPAYNEQETIQAVLKELPRNINGIESIETVLVNDGSTDNTVKLARQAGIRHIVELNSHQGLGVAFKAGLSYALDTDAGIIINMDADLQCRGEEIEKIIRPLQERTADCVIGDRQLGKMEKYPLYKLILQAGGSFLVSLFFRQKINDVASGFRAYNRISAETLKNNLTNHYTYTLESICILLKKRVRVLFVPIRMRHSIRKSRLISSEIFYIINFLATLFNCLYKQY